MADEKNKNAKPSDREFTITRVFDAPKSLVFKAWTDPKHLARWWGPHGFTGTVTMDARPGGAFRIVMRSPDGVDYPMNCMFREIVANERLVYTCDLSEHPQEWHDLIDPGRPKGQPPAEILTSVTFEERDGKTTMTVHMTFATAELRDSHVKHGMNAGWSQSFERLEDLVVEIPDREIVTTRVYDAPRELVWNAWTDPKQIAQWWGPNGFTTTIHEMNVKPGGVWRFIMHGPNGVDYKNENHFVEVVKPQWLVYDHVSAPKHHVTVNFEDQGGKTKMTMRMRFESAELREKVIKTFGAVEGAKQTFERLGDYLGKMLIRSPKQ